LCNATLAEPHHLKVRETKKEKNIEKKIKNYKDENEKKIHVFRRKK